MEDAPADVAGTAAVGGDSEEEQQEMPYIDRVVSVAEEGEDEDFESSDDDDDGEEGGNEEELSDDELIYDSDESSVRVMRNGDRLAPSPNERLGSPGAGELNWRLDKKQSFSDWTIEVSIEGEEYIAEPKQYHVHRAIIAIGARKCGYFDSICHSGQFRESASHTSKVELPDKMAVCFPDFLDYLYAPAIFCKNAITVENFMALRFLSDYFLVPKLSEDVKDFIKEDMYRLDNARMMMYLSEFGTSDDADARELIAHAAEVCAEMVLHIKKDSPFLYALPLAFFLHIMTTLNSETNILIACNKTMTHICKLIISYIKNHQDVLDEQYFRALIYQLPFPMDNTSAAKVAILLLEISKKTSWQMDSDGSLQRLCVAAIWKKVETGDRTDLGSIPLLFDRIPLEVSHALFAISFNAKNRYRQTSEDPFQITISFKTKNEFEHLLGEEVWFFVESSDSVDYVKYQIFRRVRILPAVSKLYFGDTLLDDEGFLCDYDITADTDLVLCSIGESIMNGRLQYRNERGERQEL